LLLNELLPLLPPERARDAHLIATAMTIAAREAAVGEGWQGEIARQLHDFYGQSIEVAGLWGDRLLARLAADLRNGAFETSPSRAATARAILWRLTIEKLREANPQFLVANGLRNTGGRGT